MKKQLVIVFIFVYSCACAQRAELSVQKGNDLYKLKQYEPAKTAYEEALAYDPSSKTAKSNLASTNYRLSKKSEAIKGFDELAINSSNATDKARAFYNKGAILSDQKRLEESIEAYKSALRQNPDDKEARENLQKALLELKKKTPPPKKEEKKKQEQNKKQQQQPKMNQKEAEQKLKLLQQKEKDLQQKMQKSKTGAGSPKDW
ncbi:MAG: tetratricopeptide repeat protein [Chitinophagaceae bacterium]|nr:tetratricopeptide repeat protein [Chitinophagaceae bacterium]